jgi:hypothetical protein
LTLEQEVYAGDAGGSNGAGGGTAGVGISNITLSQNGISSLTGISIAQGGAGGNSENTGASGGGTANATISLTSTTVGAITATAASNYFGGGNGLSAGGNVTSGSGAGGAGAIGNATSTADNTSTGSAFANADAAGGSGGFGSGVGFSGGHGGSATSTATAISVTGEAQATAVAGGGNGGAINNSAIAGTSGFAMTTAVSHGVTVTDFIPAGQGGIAGGQVTWISTSGNTVEVGPGGVNSGQGTVTGPLAHIQTISGTGSLTVGNGTNATDLQFNSFVGGSSQGTLTIAAGSTLDINNDHFFVNYGTNPDPVATIRGYLTSGYNNGSWNGLGIDTSAPTGSLYGVGYADGADGVVAGLTSGQIEIKYTLYGDANLDGVVNGDDFTILAGNLGKSNAVWDQGDFNYDGVVNGDDFTALVGNLGKSASGASIEIPASDIAAINAFAAANGLMTDVPEPTTVALVAFAAGGLLFRRRRRTY